MTHVVVLGARGRLGRALVTEVSSHGIVVTAVSRFPEAVSRSTPAVRWECLSPEDSAGHRRLFSTATHVMDARNQRYDNWSQYPKMISHTLQALQGTGARYLYIDNVYCYGPTGLDVISEDAPRHPSSRKGMIRLTVEEMVMNAKTIEPVATIRFPDFYNITTDSLSQDRLRWYGDRNLPHQFIHTADAARAVWQIAMDSRAYHQIWHVAGAPPVSAGDLQALARRVLDRPIRLHMISPAMISLLGLVNRDARGFRETRYLWDQPLILDDSKFHRQYGKSEFLTHAQALKDLDRNSAGL
ncbi:MAG: Rossmann-fold NAD(P)-binding domain-containing protein [Sulfobacillus sp.]